MTRHLERDLLAAGERVVRVPPKLMANARSSARTYGKSDPIDALAVARAALREHDLPTAYLDGPEREVRLLVDHREALVAERRGPAAPAGTLRSPP
jgi:transposase